MACAKSIWHSHFTNIKLIVIWERKNRSVTDNWLIDFFVMMFMKHQHYFPFKETTIYETVFDGEAKDPGNFLIFNFAVCQIYI